MGGRGGCCSVHCRMRGCHQLTIFSLCLIILCLLPLGVLTRPQTQPRGEEAVVGGQIGALVSDIYNDIIRSRLKNLLEGVSSSPPLSSISSLTSTLLESSDPLQNRGRGEKGEDPLLEVSLPKSVTPIPPELFTSLPGTKKLFSVSLEVFNCKKFSLQQRNLKTCKKLAITIYKF